MLRLVGEVAATPLPLLYRVVTGGGGKILPGTSFLAFHDLPHRLLDPEMICL